MKRSSRGFSLVEGLVALTILASLGVTVLTMVSGGSRRAAAGSRKEAASLLAWRIMDRFLSLGYPRLKAIAGKSGTVRMDLLAGDEQPAATGQDTVVLDGIEFNALFQVQEPEPGLVELRVVLAWKSQEGTEISGANEMQLARLLANPLPEPTP